ncbi:MAG: hypothetical protein ACI89G_002898, partial [Minisyncoccia bacterium]
MGSIFTELLPHRHICIPVQRQTTERCETCQRGVARSAAAMVQSPMRPSAAVVTTVAQLLNAAARLPAALSPSFDSAAPSLKYATTRPRPQQGQGHNKAKATTRPRPRRTANRQVVKMDGSAAGSRRRKSTSIRQARGHVGHGSRRSWRPSKWIQRRSLDERNGAVPLAVDSARCGS